MTRKICSIYLGCQPYNVGLEYQRQAKNLVLQGIWDAVFLIIEHPPVITIGMHGIFNGISHCVFFNHSHVWG